MKPNADNSQCILSCAGDEIPNAGNTACVRCAGQNMVPNADNSACVFGCAGNSIPNADNSGCTACAGNEIPNAGKTACVACTGNEIPNGDYTACVMSCTGNRSEVYTADDGAFCVEDLPSAGRYTARECEGAEWTVVRTVVGGQVRETCEIPVRVEIAAAAAAGVRPQLVSPVPIGMTDYESCVLREHAAFDDGVILPRCDNERLFGALGLPRKPGGFDAAPSARLVVSGGAVSYNDAPVGRFSFPSGGGGGGGGGGSDDGVNRVLKYSIFTVVGALLLTGEWGMDPSGFAFSPDYSFSAADGGSAYSVGGRLEYTRGDVSAFWTASRRTSDDLYYATGLEFGRDFWNFGYLSEITGESADVEFSAALSDGRGIFGWRSGLTGGWREDGLSGDFSAFWRNSLTADIGNWRLTPSADFRWRGGGGFGDAVDLRLNLRREF